jgi:putative ABC transport system permease protein
MNALAFAWRSLVRQPARAALGVLGVAAVGALLFDMLLLSQGLVVSMRDILDRTGWDVRITATDDLPGQGPRVADAPAVLRAVRALPQVKGAVAVRFADGRVERAGADALEVELQGVDGAPLWTILDGDDAARAGDVVIDQRFAGLLAIGPGDRLTVRASCASGDDALPPVTLRVAGIGDFPFDTNRDHTVAMSMATLADACGGNAGTDANMVLAASTTDAAQTADAIEAAVAGVRAATNEEVLGRIQRAGFSYFRQISAVLTTVTLAFAVLLITVLLTVSVNQRLGEIAALRALGFSRRRVVADVLSESALIVGTGGLLSLPLGWGLAQWLDTILTRIPGLPADLHFFVFEPSALGIHLSLLTVTALVAALYPMHVVSRLPIAATLRNEVLG